MRKIFPLILILLLLFSFPVSSFAFDPEGLISASPEYGIFYLPKTDVTMDDVIGVTYVREDETAKSIESIIASLKSSGLTFLWGTNEFRVAGRTGFEFGATDGMYNPPPKTLASRGAIPSLNVMSYKGASLVVDMTTGERTSADTDDIIGEYTSVDMMNYEEGPFIPEGLNPDWKSVFLVDGENFQRIPFYVYNFAVSPNERYVALTGREYTNAEHLTLCVYDLKKGECVYSCEYDFTEFFYTAGDEKEYSEKGTALRVLGIGNDASKMLIEIQQTVIMCDISQAVASQGPVAEPFDSFPTVERDFDNPPTSDISLLFLSVAALSLSALFAGILLRKRSIKG